MRRAVRNSGLGVAVGFVVSLIGGCSTPAPVEGTGTISGLPDLASWSGRVVCSQYTTGEPGVGGPIVDFWTSDATESFMQIFPTTNAEAKESGAANTSRIDYEDSPAALQTTAEDVSDDALHGRLVAGPYPIDVAGGEPNYSATITWDCGSE